MVASSFDPSVMIVKVWGLPGDLPIPCNFDGDRFVDFTVFRPSTGEWLSYLSSNPIFAYTHVW